MGPAQTPALVAEGITVRFGGLTALDEVSLSVPAGDVVGVIGPNGAGKTTLFNVVCGFVRPTAGTLTLHGRSLRRHHPHQLARLGIARTLQGLGLFPNLSVLDNVTAGAGRVGGCEPPARRLCPAGAAPLGHRGTPAAGTVAADTGRPGRRRLRHPAAR